MEYFKHTFACVPSMVFDGGCNEIFTVLENKLKLFRHPKIEDDFEAFFACAMRHDGRSCAEHFKGSGGTIANYKLTMITKRKISSI